MQGKMTKGGESFSDANTLDECKLACETSQNCLGISWTGTACSAINGPSFWEDVKDSPLVRSFLAVPQIKPSRMHTMALFILELVVVIIASWALLRRKKL